MKPYADLEISLHRHNAESYLVEFRFSQPDSDADIRLGQGEPALVHIDQEVLQSLAYDPPSYGKQLTEFFFADPQVRNDSEQASACELAGRNLGHSEWDKYFPNKEYQPTSLWFPTEEVSSMRGVCHE